MQKRTQNPEKRVKKPKKWLQIRSFAFSRPSLILTCTKIEGGQMRQGYYLGAGGTVHIYAQDDGYAGSTFGRLDMNYAGREYRLSFDDSPGRQGLMRRCRAFALQVQQMAAAEVRALPLGAVVPAPAVVATVGESERRQLPLFDAGSMPRAHHLDEMQAVLTDLLRKAKVGTPLVAPISYALAVVDAERVRYGITPTVATGTAAAS